MELHQKFGDLLEWKFRATSVKESIVAQRITQLKTQGIVFVTLAPPVQRCSND
jgi:hypothetical protein